MLRFNRRYFAATLILFITEVLIAAFLNDRIIRPYVGDFLVVMLIYCFVKSFLDIPVIPLAIAVLGFAFLIEFLQYLGIVQRLAKSNIARIVVGNSFEWGDLIVYTAGVIAILYFEKAGTRKPHKSQQRAATNDHRI